MLDVVWYVSETIIAPCWTKNDNLPTIDNGDLTNRHGNVSMKKNSGSGIGMDEHIDVLKKL